MSLPNKSNTGRVVSVAGLIFSQSSSNPVPAGYPGIYWDGTSMKIVAADGSVAVDGEGASIYAPADLVSTSNVAGTYSGTALTLTVTATGALTVDGQTAAAGMRLLLAGQSTASQNGLYVVTTAGTTGVHPLLTRASDQNTSGAFISGSLVPVKSGGTTYGGTVWQLSFTPPFTLDTTTPTFTQEWKTLTAPVIAGGLTASGSAANDFSGSTGAFNTSTGTNTIGGNLAMAAGKKITPASAGGVDFAGTPYTLNWALGVVPTTATQGNDTANTNGDVYWAAVEITQNTTFTGIQYLIGSVGGTDKAIAALYSAAGGLLASSALAGTTVGTAANFMQLPFTAPYAAVGPGLYYLALQFNGTTAKFRSQGALAGMVGSASFATGSVSGTFGTLPSLTPGTSFTANKGPIASTY